MEFKAPGRVASTVGKRRGKPSEKLANQGNPTFLFRIVKFADLTGVKSDRLLARKEQEYIAMKEEIDHMRAELGVDNDH